MPWALATITTPTEYLAELADGAWVRTDCPLNAILWEDLAGLLAWLDTLPPERIARLDQVGVRPVEVTIPAGVPWGEVEASARFQRALEAA